MERKFKQFEIRWADSVGRPECPFLIRWVLTLFGYSLRLHKWVGSDDPRAFHDHPWDFWSMIILGCYFEITPSESDSDLFVESCRICLPWELRFYSAEHKHIVYLGKCKSCWSIVFSKPHRRNFGFYIPGREKMMRPLRYFSRFGLHPCEK